MKKDIFYAISDPTRRAILVLVAVQAMTPNALAEHFSTSRQAVSKHVKVLSACALLKQKQTGREIYYHFNAEKMKELDQWLSQFSKLWDARFNQLDKLITKRNKKDEQQSKT